MPGIPLTMTPTSKTKNNRVIAFCLFKYFPYGGLQRDFLKIALRLQALGYGIRVYVQSWRGALPPAFARIVVPVSALTNHGRCWQYQCWVQRHLAEHPVAAVVGFNKMPGLDLYYAADCCYQHKVKTQRRWYYRLLPRYRLFTRLEQAVFAPTAGTEILLLSAAEAPLFERYYHTPAHRFHLLPPGIARNNMTRAERQAVRAEFRQEYGLAATDRLLLLVGSGFITKGLDRILRALHALPPALAASTRLFVVGQDSQAAFMRLARRLGVTARVTFMGGRDDVPRFLLGADLLVHPAYAENSGTVLLEAVAAGLPVLTTEVCGYAGHVQAAAGGLIIPSPFRQETMNEHLVTMLDSAAQRAQWAANGLAYAATTDLYSMPEQAAGLIATFAAAKEPSQAGADRRETRRMGSG